MTGESGPDPVDADGFRAWRPPVDGRFSGIYGTLRLRAEPDGRVRVRVATGEAQANIAGTIHGGFVLAFVDQAVFCGPGFLGRLPAGGAVTLSASATFLAPGRPGGDLDAVVEIVGETGRLLFLRGIMEQGATRVATFEATLRKMAAPKAAAGDAA